MCPVHAHTHLSLDKEVSGLGCILESLLPHLPRLVTVFEADIPQVEEWAGRGCRLCASQVSLRRAVIPLLTPQLGHK